MPIPVVVLGLYPPAPQPVTQELGFVACNMFVRLIASRALCPGFYLTRTAICNTDQPSLHHMQTIAHTVLCITCAC